MKYKLILAITCVILCLLFCSCDKGAGNTGDSLPASAPSPEPEPTKQESETMQVWTIRVDDKVKKVMYGKLTIEWAVNFFAINIKDSPYGGEFIGEATIKSFMDDKKEFGLNDVQKLTYEAKQESEMSSIKFSLKKPQVVPLVTPPANLNERIEIRGEAEFTIHTKGDNLASYSLVVPGHATESAPELNISIPSELTQTYDEVVLNLELYGEKIEFKGKIALEEFDKEEAMKRLLISMSPKN